MLTRSPTIAEALLEVLRRELGKLFVARPGRVTRFDPATGYADVKPLLMGSTEDRKGNRSAVSLDVIQNVPVYFFGGGGKRMTCPVKKDDVVLLIFCDRSLDVWKKRRGEVDPLDTRTHAMADAIALVGLRTWTGVDENAITIGTEGGAYQGAGLGANLRTELDALWTALAGHGHPVTVNGTTHTGATTGTTGASSSKQTVESATVKVTP